jgi:hypothetical protein
VGRVGYRHDKRPRRVTSSATGMDCVHELYHLVEAMARSLEKVRAPVSELDQLLRGVHESPGSWEARLVEEAAAHRQATFAGGEKARNDGLQGGAAGPAVASLEQHRDEGAESFNRLAEGDVVTTPQCRPAGMSVTMKGGLLATRPEDNGPTTSTRIIGSLRNGVSDTDGRTDGDVTTVSY